MQQVINNELTKQAILTDYWGCVQQTIRKAGNKEFIVTKNGSLTYSETNQRANVICQAIRAQTGKTKLGIGLFLKDPCSVVPAMMGVLKSGNYIVPLDVGFPDSTLQYMFQNGGIQLILTDSQHIERVNTLLPDELKVINLDVLDFAVEVADPVVSYAPDDIVQVLFTSGSTSQPKGALEDYRYLARAVYHRLAIFDYQPDDRILNLSSFTFSAFHILLFTTLLNRLTICFYNIKDDGLAGLPEWINQQCITIYSSTSTVFRSLISILKPGERFPTVRDFTLSGEKRLRSDLQAMRQYFPRAGSIRLGFATTETQAIASTTYPVDYDFDQETLPCGKPYDDLKVFIWDEQSNPLPPGEEGEIVVYGDALCRGYINNPQLTRERFFADPDHPGWQYFKTGDLGKFLPDGQLLHLGRLDNMVKIKGVRIELESIESHMLSYPGIIQVASKAFEDAKGNKKLVSYFVCEKGIEVPISDLRKHLAERLPLHLLPHYLMGVRDLPLTGTGKIALSQLPLPQMVRPELTNAYEPPADEMERKLVEIWEEQLGIQGIGATDDFFDVGGDSLLGVLLFVKVDEAFGRKLPVSVLLKAATVRQLAEVIRKEDVTQDFKPVIPINPVGEKAPLFFIPGKGGYPIRIRHLAKYLDSQTPVYAMQDLSRRRKYKFLHSIEAVAAFYLGEINKIYPHGPYILVGESSGGKIVYEMAQQLLKRGEKEPVLVLLDTYNFTDSAIDYYKSKHNLPFYQMLIKKHLSILIQANWQGRLDYLRFYRTTFKQKAKRFLRRRLRHIKQSAMSALPKNVRQAEESTLQAIKAYELQPYPGRVILFKAMRGPKAYDPANGWDRIELGRLDIHTLDCYHGSILFDPAVRRLAEILQGYIEKI